MAKPADERLTLLRKEMEKADGGKGVDAYIVPTEDAHMVRPAAWHLHCSACWSWGLMHAEIIHSACSVSCVLLPLGTWIWTRQSMMPLLHNTLLL